MLAGVKIVPRDQVLEEKEHELDDSRSARRKSRSKKKKERRRKNSFGFDSSEDEGLEKIKKGSRKKKWYASDESLSSSFSDSGDEESLDGGQRKGKGRRKEKRRNREENPKDKSGIMSKKKPGRSNNSSKDNSESEEQCRIGDEVNIIRREMGLDWMTRHAYKVDNNASQSPGEKSEDPPKEENTDLHDSKRTHHPDTRAPKLHDSFSWGRRKTQNSSDADLISSTVASLNKFENDGSFLQKVMTLKNESIDISGDKLDKISEAIPDSKMDLLGKRPDKDKQPLSANQLAAKALQLRVKGQHEEADKLMKEAESVKPEQEVGERSHRPRAESSRYAMQDAKARQKKDEDDSDMHLAQRIMKNKKFSVSGQADDEYDYDDDAPSKRSKKKGVRDEKASLVSKQSFSRHIMTQKERCQFCFESPNKPKHLVVAIANFTYLILPQWQPVAAGHCCILPLQHEASTRSVDDNVWEEIRNFKKCLIMMFAKQEKDVVFLETVVGLAQQRCHCMIECIPLPQEIVKEAPLYFKKAIDEAGDEWSQHNAKKLIDTSQKGLRGSIPKNFPYFHVEFGLNRGFVHVIDDEKEFKTSLGLNVIRGMLQLSEEDMYRRRRYESVESQKQAVASFAREWEPFDWTKQLG